MISGNCGRTIKSLNFPLQPSVSHVKIQKSARAFAAKYLPRAVVFTSRQHRQAFRAAGSKGLLGVTIAQKYGGQGMNSTSSVIVHHELSKVSPGFCLSYLAHSILFAHHFSRSASNLQKAQILPKICAGQKIGALALSELHAGTDIKGMQTYVRRTASGAFVLNGSKLWITNGPIADYFLVYAIVRDAHKKSTNLEKTQQIGCFLLQRGMKGLHIGPVIPKCGMQPAVMCALTFRNVSVPRGNLVGSVLDGWKSLMSAFAIERLNLAAMALGIAEGCLEQMVDYARLRSTFGKPLYQHGQIQKYISEGFSESLAAKVLIYSISASNTLNRLETDAAKLFTAPIAKKIADNAIQVCGAMGYSGKMNLEQFWRDAKLLEIGGGTLEAHQKNIVKDIMR
ncbi:isovaleryl-coA dehydrogenase [Perkinsela sp. CCAP 1560/4]|nr:isovaleryl-coA dehydrogenase [Perkinsela sp. CCAP 1560/4]|eukprot:KNH09510.1 isovaleryl-coA dehydrogenase [Perkinsela sp. CCAP 1560/4]